MRDFAQMGLHMTYDGKFGNFLSVKQARVLPYEIKEKVEEMKEANMEGKECIDNDKRAFNIFYIIVTQMESNKVMTDCKNNDKKVQYFSNTGKNIQSYATRLTLVAELNTEYIGTNTSLFLLIFPELRILHIHQATSILEIYMVELLKLQELIIHAESPTTNVHCAFNGTTCLTNLNGLQKLELTGGLGLIGNITQPKKIG